jgi:hypothetical protein
MNAHFDNEKRRLLYGAHKELCARIKVPPLSRVQFDRAMDVAIKKKNPHNCMIENLSLSLCDTVEAAEFHMKHHDNPIVEYMKMISTN